MKQQRRRAARAECVIRKRLILFKKAYLLCIILSWLGWSKVKSALMLIIYYKILSFTLLDLVFLYSNPFLTVILVWLYIIFGKIIKLINIFEQLILKTPLKLPFLQVCVADKFILFISLIVHKYFVFYKRSVRSYYTKC